MQSYNECIKKLIDLGQKNQNLLTFKQINNILPNSPIYLDKIDDIISELVDAGIELIDETRRRLRKKLFRLKKQRPKSSRTNAIMMIR